MSHLGQTRSDAMASPVMVIPAAASFSPVAAGRVGERALLVNQGTWLLCLHPKGGNIEIRAWEEYFNGRLDGTVLQVFKVFRAWMSQKRSKLEPALPSRYEPAPSEGMDPFQEKLPLQPSTIILNFSVTWTEFQFIVHDPVIDPLPSPDTCSGPTQTLLSQMLWRNRISSACWCHCTPNHLMISPSIFF